LLVYVRFNPSHGFPVELEQGASVAELKETVGHLQGIQPDRLRVIFAGRELLGMGIVKGFNGITTLTDTAYRIGTLTFMVVLTEAKAHSSFYVFCKTVCKAIQPGKLCVRCRDCKQGTLTLSRGPSCWDDVLLPNRIHGVCQSQDCDGRLVEFYLKCAAHPTCDNDTSAALDLIMLNTRRVPCIACTDIMTPVLVFQCAERHVICLECFHLYCVARLNERQFTQEPLVGYSLPCAAGCPDSLIKEVHHFQVLGDEQYERYQRYAAEECVLQMGGVLCLAPGCSCG
uniref:Parkin RBR E3 ubiquitin protein ligase n=1 Tax=Sinocyclocheilus grahami TaxID=75366 RepID=A0A672T9S9_SINGR